MCDSYEERLHEVRRIEQMRKEAGKAAELKKQSKTATPAKPTAPATGVEEHEAVPA